MTQALRLAALSAAVLLGGCYAVVPVAPAPVATGTAVDPGYSSSTVAQGTTCYAGVYVCTMPAPGAVGSPCACPGLGAPSYGTVH